MTNENRSTALKQRRNRTGYLACPAERKCHWDTVELLGDKFEVVGLSRGTSSWMSLYVFVTLVATCSLGYSGKVSYHLLCLPEGSDVNNVAKVIEEQISGVEALNPKEIARADSRVMATVMDTVMDTQMNVMLFIGVIIGIAVMGLPLIPL